LFSCGLTKEQNTIVVYLDDDIILDNTLIKEAYQTYNITVEFATARQKYIINKRLAKFPDKAIRLRAKYILKHIDVYMSADLNVLSNIISSSRYTTMVFCSFARPHENNKSIYNNEHI
jgi:hypothetical protein